MIRELREKEVVGFSSTGRPREYQLRLRFVFRVIDRDSQPLLPPTEVVLRRDITSSDVELVAKPARGRDAVPRDAVASGAAAAAAPRSDPAVTQIRAEGLAAALARGVPPLVWVHGDEPLLVQEAAQVVRQALRAAGFAERQVFDGGRGFRPDAFVARQTRCRCSPTGA